MSQNEHFALGTTRSGRVFRILKVSPHEEGYGVPILAPPEFSLEACGERWAQQADDSDSEDDSPSQQTEDDPDSPSNLDEVLETELLSFLSAMERSRSHCRTKRKATSSPAPTTESRPSKQRCLENKQSGSNRRRALRRNAKGRSRDTQKVRERHWNDAISNAYMTGLDAVADLQAAASGYIGQRAIDHNRLYTRDELLVDHGFLYYPWDGITTIPIIDREGRLIALLGGTPKNDQTWAESMAIVDKILSIAERHIRYTKKQTTGRRGNFSSVTCGYSFGGGQQRPKAFSLSKKTTNILKWIGSKADFQRLLGFTGSLYQTFNPHAYARCQKMMAAMGDHFPDTNPPFPGSPWPSTTKNGAANGNVITVGHIDHANDAQGWCGISASGDFSPDDGGDCVLWDLKLVVRFPPTSTILIPSALLRHSNTPLEKGIRRSLIQFAPGGLFRYYDNGMVPDNVRFKDMSPEEKIKELNRRRAAWKEAINTFYRIDITKVKNSFIS